LLSVTAIDSQSVQVTWRAPTQPNGVLISYTITYTTETDRDSYLTIDVPYNGNTVKYTYIHVTHSAKRGLIPFSIACTWQPIT